MITKFNEKQQFTQTQLILSSLLEKIQKQEDKSVKDFRQYLTSNQISPCKHRAESVNSQITSFNEKQRHFGKQLFYVEQSPEKLSNLDLNQQILRMSKKKQKKQKHISEPQSKQLQNILRQQNQILKSKLQKYEKESYMLISYQSEVQFLKKVNLIQSQQIQKLRKILRLKQINQSSLLIKPEKVFTEKDNKICQQRQNSKNISFFKNNMTNKKSKSVHLQGSTQKKNKKRESNDYLQKQL